MFSPFYLHAGQYVHHHENCLSVRLSLSIYRSSCPNEAGFRVYHGHVEVTQSILDVPTTVVYSMTHRIRRFKRFRLLLCGSQKA